MSEIAIISTGDPEEDARKLRQAKIHDDRINEGICPNGCALLVWETAFNANCPVCIFLYSTNLPYGKRECEQIM